MILPLLNLAHNTYHKLVSRDNCLISESKVPTPSENTNKNSSCNEKNCNSNDGSSKTNSYLGRILRAVV